MVFSSSATVYGQPDETPCVEDFQLVALNPYGRTKVCNANDNFELQKLNIKVTNAEFCFPIFIIVFYLTSFSLKKLLETFKRLNQIGVLFC